MESCNLPTELLIDILARLPVRSLMRFKSVCKFFYYSIKSDRHLMHKHYALSKARSDGVVIDSGGPIVDFYLLEKESESDEIQLAYLNTANSGLIRHVKCCHGLLCLIFGTNDSLRDTSDSYNILIWNPSTREFKALPTVTVPYKADTAKAMLVNEGFGFGFSNNMIMTWKVVMLWHFDYYRPPKDCHNIGMIYRQDGDAWSLAQIDAPPHAAVYHNQDFYLKGKHYWRVDIMHSCHHMQMQMQTAEYYNLQSLLWFDMDSEIFGTIKLPFIQHLDVITVMNETIALASVNEKQIVIWLMLENESNITWHKHATLDIFSSIEHHEYWTPVGSTDEFWQPIGIWDLNRQLLALPNANSLELEDEERYIPYMISVDLATQKWKAIYPTKERKSIKIIKTSTGYVQIYNERNISVPHEWWEEGKIFQCNMHMRVYNASLYSL